MPTKPGTEPRVVAIVANARAGTVLEMGDERFHQWMNAAFEAYGIRPQIDLLSHEEIASRVDTLIEQEDRDVFVAGGDGTIFRLLPRLAEARRPVGIIPLGTVNLLGRDLGVHDAIDAVARAYRNRSSQRVSLGAVNGILFHSNVGIGILGRMARERERARGEFPFSRAFSFAMAALRTLIYARPFNVRLASAGREESFEADAVLVTNNIFDGMPWRRENLDARILECHVLAARGFANRLSMIWAVLRGRWREHPALRSFLVRELTIAPRQRHRMSVAIDGESFRLDAPLAFSVAPQAVRFYGMRGDEAE